MSKTAHIIAIKVDSLGDLGFGISGHPGDVAHIFESGEVWVGPRPSLETDFGFVQPIPYIVIRDGDRVLAYSRAATGGEARLHKKVSIGFGGHVDVADAMTHADGSIDLERTLRVAMGRELVEELGIVLPADTCSFDMLGESIAFTHLISSAASDVDRVHIGLVGSIDVKYLPVSGGFVFEDAIENAYWTSIDGLFTDAAAGLIVMENWTHLLADSLSATDA